MAQDVMTTDQAAAFLRTSRTTVLRKARRGLLPGSRLGRAWCFRRKDLDAWLDAKFDEEFDRDYARRKADPRNYEKPKSHEEVMRELGL